MEGVDVDEHVEGGVVKEDEDIDKKMEGVVVEEHTVKDPMEEDVVKEAMEKEVEEKAADQFKEIFGSPTVNIVIFCL